MADDDEFTLAPSEEHSLLLELEGEWDVLCRYFTGDDDLTIEVEGKESITMLGGFWAVGTLTADVMGTPLHGRSSFGYDPERRVYISTWQDSMNPHFYFFEGQYDMVSGILHLSGRNFDPRRGAASLYRSAVHFTERRAHRQALGGRRRRLRHPDPRIPVHPPAQEGEAEVGIA
ncbi:MAG: DUF1579 family protein [Verrucomicrobiales bacterium]